VGYKDTQEIISNDDAGEPVTTEKERTVRYLAVCEVCMATIQEYLSQGKEWDKRGWVFTSQKIFISKPCSRCGEDIPKETPALIIKYKPSSFSPLYRTMMYGEARVEYLCPHCVEEFVNEAKEDLEGAMVRRFERLL
jgi:formylmethanofuran dehydrogenase subunit E